MTPWIEKARKALLTGQPRLAELYMRRGLQEDLQGRAWLARHDAIASARRLGRAAQRVLDALAGTLAGGHIFATGGLAPVDRSYMQYRAEIMAREMVFPGLTRGYGIGGSVA